MWTFFKTWFILLLTVYQRIYWHGRGRLIFFKCGTDLKIQGTTRWHETWSILSTVPRNTTHHQTNLVNQTTWYLKFVHFCINGSHFNSTLMCFQVMLFYSIRQAVQCLHIFLHPFINYIIFFLQLCLLFQSSSTNPFSPTSPLIPSAKVSLGLSHFLLPGGRHFITSFGNLPPSILKWCCFES
jgi:hypothetical protein